MSEFIFKPTTVHEIWVLAAQLKKCGYFVSEALTSIQQSDIDRGALLFYPNKAAYLFTNTEWFEQRAEYISFYFTKLSELLIYIKSIDPTLIENNEENELTVSLVECSI